MEDRMGKDEIVISRASVSPFRIVFSISSCIACLLFFSACNPDYSPKQKAYPRVIFPERKYIVYEGNNCPFKFEIPDYASVVRDSTYFDAQVSNNECWLNIVLPALNGTINLTYKNIDAHNGIEKLIEDAHKMAFKHTRKADYIDEIGIHNEHGVGGLLYDVGGDAASQVQFFLTDSSHHFIRGALYFNNPPNTDSMAPVLSFVKEDIKHILQTFEWK